MIDKVRISKNVTLDTSKFSKKFRYVRRERVNKETGEVYWIDGYFYFYHGLSIRYSTSRDRLIVEGRLPNLLITRDRVHNLDDYLLGIEKLLGFDETRYDLTPTEMHSQSYYDADDQLQFPDEEVVEIEPVFTIKSLDNLINKANRKLFEVTGVKLDIRDFIVTYAEVTFNVQTPYVKEYIEMFNMTFLKSDNSRYVNYVLTNDKKPYTSFYVKSKANYRDNTNRAFTINFYNKENQLEYIRDIKGINVTHEDLLLAKDILRLEIKQGYTDLKKDSRRFCDFLEITNAMKKIVVKYELFINKQDVDFYSYQKAKAVVEATPVTGEFTARIKRNLLNSMLDATKGKKFSKEQDRLYKKRLANLGIHWCFIPTKWGIDCLESPMKLLKVKVDEIEKLDQVRKEEAKKYQIRLNQVEIKEAASNPFDF